MSGVARTTENNGKTENLHVLCVPCTGVEPSIDDTTVEAVKEVAEKILTSP